SPAPQTLSGSSGILAGASTALRAALAPFQAKLPAGAEKKFVEDRRQMLLDLNSLADKAERSLGGDPSTYRTFDALVDHLMKQEGMVAKNLGVGGEVTDWSKLPDRVAKVRLARPELGNFVEQLWSYRSFLQQNLAAKEVPIPIGTHFRPWELYPEGKGTRGATLEGYTRGGIGYVALAYDRGNGVESFQGVNRDAHKALIIQKKGGDLSVAEIDFDGAGKALRSATDRFVSGVLAEREAHDAGKNLHEIRHYQNGREVSVESLDPASGVRSIRDLVSGTVTTVDQNRVEIKGKPAPPGTPPAVMLTVGMIDAYGHFALQKMVMQDGQQIVVKSPNVNQLLDDKNNNLGWNVELMDLAGLTDPAARRKKADSIAAQTIKAVFGAEDAERVKELSGFLLDKARVPSDADTKNGPPVRLSVNKHNEFSLILGHRDGTKTILTAVFQKAPVYRDVVQGRFAFGVLHEAKMGTDGRVSPYDSSVQWQYLFDGSKVRWATQQDDPKDTAAPWYKPWKDDEIVTHAFMFRSTRQGGAWKEEPGDGWESKKDLLVEKKGSTLSRLANSKPVAIVGGALNSVSMYAHAGWDASLGAVTGSDAIKLEARTLWNNNPANRLFMKDPEKSLLGSLPAAQRAMLAETAVKNRVRTLESTGVTESRRPVDLRLASEAAVSNNEMMGAAANFSAGEYMGDHGNRLGGFLVSMSGQVVEIAAGVAVTGGIASGVGKLTLGGVARFAPRMLTTVTKVGTAAVKLFDFSMMAAGGAMVINDGVSVVRDWGDEGARYSNLGKVTADMGFVAFFAAQRFKGKGPEGTDGAFPPEPVKLEVPPVQPDPLTAAPKPSGLDVTVPPGEPPAELPVRMPDTPRDMLAANDNLPPAPREGTLPSEPVPPSEAAPSHETPVDSQIHSGENGPNSEHVLQNLHENAETLTSVRPEGELNVTQPNRGVNIVENGEPGAGAGGEGSRGTGDGGMKKPEAPVSVKGADPVGDSPAGEKGGTRRSLKPDPEKSMAEPANDNAPKPDEEVSMKPKPDEEVSPKPKPEEEVAAEPKPEEDPEVKPRAAEDGDAEPKPAEEKGVLRKVNDWLADREATFKRFAGGSKADHPMPAPVTEPTDAKGTVWKVDDAPAKKVSDGGQVKRPAPAVETQD
ncbi:MAG: hypothetical protein KGL74_10875, partial [Elusimicrobia bacterium]|nr:hypothetical protein [Elusimicrobiota bacterium]